MEQCIFCKITKGEIQAEIVYKDENFVVFKDIKPKAPLHLLIVPKRHILSVEHLQPKDREFIGELILVAKKVARAQRINKTGYKLVFNVGKGGGQIINHLHLHLLAGWKSAEERDIPGMP